MPIISRDVPAYETNPVNPASQAVNATYSDTAACAPPCYVALDLSGAGALGNVWVTWYNIANNFDYTVMGGGTYGLPSTYTLEANPAAGGALPAIGWVILASATGEHCNARDFALNLTGYHWLRMNVTVVAGSPGNTDASFQLDVSTANDGWFLGGDSITSDAMTQDETYGGTMSPPKPNFAEQVNAALPSRFPLQIDGGIGGITATTVAGTYGGPDMMKGWLAKFPGQYVTLNYGTNDAYGPATDYYNAMSTLVQDVLAVGKTPIVPTIPWACDGRDVKPNNQQVAKLYAAYPQVVHGPDLYSLWVNSPNIGSDCLHPSYPVGMSIYRQQWAQWALARVYGGPQAPTISSVVPSTGPLVGGTSVTITGAHFTGALPSSSVRWRRPLLQSPAPRKSRRRARPESAPWT